MADMQTEVGRFTSNALFDPAGAMATSINKGVSNVGRIVGSVVPGADVVGEELSGGPSGSTVSSTEPVNLAPEPPNTLQSGQFAHAGPSESKFGDAIDVTSRVSNKAGTAATEASAVGAATPALGSGSSALLF